MAHSSVSPLGTSSKINALVPVEATHDTKTTLLNDNIKALGQLELDAGIDKTDVAADCNIDELLNLCRASFETLESSLFEVEESRHMSLARTIAREGSLAMMPSASVGEPDGKVAQLQHELSDARTLLARTAAKAAGDARFKLLEKDFRKLESQAAEALNELKEDKWIGIFLEVSEQAKAMMASLEQMLSQCRTALDQSKSGSLDALTDLAQSLEAKSAYYVPACERAIKTIARGIFERKTYNGAVIRIFAELKARWRTILEDIENTAQALATVSGREDEQDSPLQNVSRHSVVSLSPQRKKSASALAASSSSPPAVTPAVTPPRQNARTPGSAAKPRWSVVGPSNAGTIGRASGRPSLGSLKADSRLTKSANDGLPRPVSPTLSEASAQSNRPTTPSRIPMPSSSRRASMTPLGFERALSPSNRMSSAATLMPPLGFGTPQPRSGPRRSLGAMKSVTPEPYLGRHSRRVSTFAPPVPSIPSNFRNDVKPMRRASSAFGHRPAPVYGQLAPGEPYKPNPVDPLDIELAIVVNHLQDKYAVTRIGEPATEASVAMADGLSAKYAIARLDPDGDAKPQMSGTSATVTCKLVDRVGPWATKGEKKVIVKIRSGYQDLEPYCLSL